MEGFRDVIKRVTMSLVRGLRVKGKVSGIVLSDNVIKVEIRSDGEIQRLREDNN